MDALVELHRAHVERVPYETAWIHAGQRRGIDQAESVRHVVEHRRGGYCFHLNGALAALLHSLGYDVTMHVGGVHGEVADASALGNHLVLTVAGLPTGDHPEGTWYVDAGLGDALHEPVPLREGTTEQEPFTLVLQRSPVDGTDWQLLHDARGSFTGMVFRDAPAAIADFEADHAHLSTSPSSGFVRTMTVQRRDATGIDVLRARTLTRVDASGDASDVLDRDDWFAAVHERFGMPLDDVDAAGCERLWAAVDAQHARWLAERDVAGET